MFDPIKLKWQDVDYVILPDQVLRTIAKIEDEITFVELCRHMQKQSVPIAKVALAFSIMLRAGGAKVEDAEVYDGLFGMGDKQELLNDATMVLYSILSPSKAEIEETGMGARPTKRPEGAGE